jgi:hypothetical protein
MSSRMILGPCQNLGNSLIINPGEVQEWFNWTVSKRSAKQKTTKVSLPPEHVSPEAIVDLIPKSWPIC